MQVLGEGIPLTNGEVYAILRRNRDVRFAKSLPPFGIQFRTPSSNGQQPHGLFAKRDVQSSQRAASDFFKMQNNVALYEVKCLFYLRDEAVLYGVSSVYSAAFQSNAATSSPVNVAVAEDSSSINRQFDSRFAAVSTFGPTGTKRHVAAVQKELDFLETAGRKAELSLAERLKRVIVDWRKQQDNEARPTLALTSQELHNLVAIRPKTEVAVLSVIPDLEARAGDEQAATALAQAVAATFASLS